MPRTTLLRQLLQQRHLTTHEAFAAQYERAAARLAELDRDPRLASLQVSPRQFDRWYGGELLTLPRPDACRVLEHMLGRPVSELFSTAYDGDSAHDRDEESSTGRQATSAPPPPDDDENPLDIVTRTRQLTASNADDATLAFLDSSLEGIASRYEQDGPYVLRPQARQVRQLAHTLLDGRQPPRTRRELFRLAARASGLLGYMAVNTGDFALSEAYCTEARELSREIGDLDTDLWACGTLSFSLYYAGRYDEADACATAAVERAPRHAQCIRLLANGRARALGKTGDQRAVEQTIGQALRLSDLHEVPVGLTSCISFEPYGRARTLANAVTSHVALRNTAQVLREPSTSTIWWSTRPPPGAARSYASTSPPRCCSSARPTSTTRWRWAVRPCGCAEAHRSAPSTNAPVTCTSRPGRGVIIRRYAIMAMSSVPGARSQRPWPWRHPRLRRC
ncbi:MULTISPECIES: hypothetical protein [unclassified Streptomyces]|uniref:tetratricopeptide repeat protein n=1 Tax=unclassified Streptomyces TaxID=2593676 RepID=UPI001EF2D04B|nr:MULTISPECIES: hypothetical protein [unclassified Streptomyces]